MMEKEFSSRIKNKYDNQINWETNNPILLKGEVGYINKGEKDFDFKVGDGENDFNSLSSFFDLSFLKIIQKIYPIGSIYISLNSVSPDILFGFGEWE